MIDRPFLGETRIDSAFVAEWPAIPGYEIRGELGRGGMGIVCKAWDERSNRMVALKLLRDGPLASPQEKARFLIEAQAAASVSHHNIVELYEVGEHRGWPYFTMELIRGQSLDKYLDGQPQFPAHAAELVRTLALAIQHAHDRQIVHRDLKPANVLLQCDKTDDHPSRSIPT